MSEASRAIAVIPREHFHWRPRVQFQDSFRTRDQALNYAFEHGYNLIVEQEEGKGLQYDVLYDPDQVCTSGMNLESVETEDFLAEPDPVGWTTLMVSSIVNLIKWFSAGLVTLHRRHVVPFSRHAAFVARRRYREVAPQVRISINRHWEGAERAIRRGWRTRSNWIVTNLARRFAAFAMLYLRRAEPAAHYAIAVTHRYLQKMLPVCRRAIAAAGPYFRQFGPIYKRAAAVAGPHLAKMVAICRPAMVPALNWLCKTTARLTNGARRDWPKIQIAIRRAYSSLRWDASGLDRKSQEVFVSLYRGKIEPAVRTAASRLQWENIEGSIHRPRNPEPVQLHFPFA